MPDDDYPVCDVPDCEGYGTAHGPLPVPTALLAKDVIDTTIRIAGFLVFVTGGLIGAGLPAWAILCIVGFAAAVVAS